VGLAIIRALEGREEGFVSNQNRALLTLVTFCLASVAVVALGLALVFASAAFAVGQSADPSPKPGEPKPGDNPTAAASFSGVVTDAQCKAKHPGKSRLSSADCVRVCVRSGSPFVLMDGEKVYTLHGSQADLGKFASQRATVQGVLNGDTIEVSAIAAGQ
jgi:hypothetical protein